MMYTPDELVFPKGAPYYFSNFVSTLDGKVAVKSGVKGYWPIGSEMDHKTFIGLRQYADVIVHGKTTALAQKTLTSLAKPEFHQKRESECVYLVVSGHPDEKLGEYLTPVDNDQKVLLVTTKEALVPSNFDPAVSIVRLGRERVDMKALDTYLRSENYNRILIEGGAYLLGSFIQEGMLEEVFLTLSPKIYGASSETITMVEGGLLSPDALMQLKLLSVKQWESELFLRYRVER